MRLAAVLVVGLFIAGIAVLALVRVARPPGEHAPFRFPTPVAPGAAPGPDGRAAAGDVAPDRR